MSFLSQKMRYFVAFFIIYFIFQVILLFYLKTINQTAKSDPLEILKISNEILSKLNSFSILDSSDNYRIVKLFNSDKVRFVDITLITQCSSNHLSLLRDLIIAWQGVISIAVFSEIEYLEETILSLAKLQHCSYLKKAFLYLIVPEKEKYILDFSYENYDLSGPFFCNSTQLFHSKGKKNFNWATPYPINLLRNVARKGGVTEFILVIDVDMVPSPNLRLDFINFIKTWPGRSSYEVYVVPVFEVEHDVSMLKDKNELIYRIKKKQARPFYAVPCRKCQIYTKYGDWLAADETKGTRVLYNIPWHHPWEPFFIGSSTMPDFDESFIQYGMNRVSQICELHVAGYKFLVMDNIFLIHKGFKNNNDFHDSKTSEMEKNRKLYAQFKEALRNKYPESDKFC